VWAKVVNWTGGEVRSARITIDGRT
jgi:hypothetical protein